MWMCENSLYQEIQYLKRETFIKTVFNRITVEHLF